MITTDRLDWFADTLGKSFESLPKLLAEMRATAEDRERVVAELEAAGHAQDGLNLTITDLRERVGLLDGRVHELLIANAKLERLILSAGEALRGSDAFHEAALAIAHPLRVVPPAFREQPEVGYGQ